jgi:alkyldihydroxyacetonephosphate synthase
MTIEREKLRWNGWGWIEAPDLLGARAELVWGWMAKVLGCAALPHTPPVSLEKIALPETRLHGPALCALEAVLPAARIRTDAYERAFHARGKSYADLVALRAGMLTPCPDAVVYPECTEEVLGLLRWAAQHGAAVVPYGGGSSVVGGVNTPETACPVLCVDMTRMCDLLDLDETTRIARVQAGVYGPALESALQAQGYTLGHYPQSFEFSTLGGWIAARGAGQQSNRYGKPEKWLVGAEVATPHGLWRTEHFPASAAGPQLTQLVVGSEGTLGIITEAAVRLHRTPERRDYTGYLFPDFAAGVSAARALVQDGVPTAMIRLSDSDETRFYAALQHGDGEVGEATPYCAMLLGLEGAAEEVAQAGARARAIIDAQGGMALGEGPGETWYKGRFMMPYLRDPMLDRGLGVDTLETATGWGNIAPLHAAVRGAIARAIAAHPGEPGCGGVVLAHISHCYPDGASLYFTFVFRRDAAEPLGQWRHIKAAASEAIVAHGGTISHHHGVGLDHRPWLAREKGPVGAGVLRAIKAQVDPGGIMNPGKLIP